MTAPRQADALDAAADALHLAAEAFAAAAAAVRRVGPDGTDAPAGYVSLEEAAAAFGLSRSGLHAAITRGEISSRTIGRRRFVPRTELEARRAPDVETPAIVKTTGADHPAGESEADRGAR